MVVSESEPEFLSESEPEPMSEHQAAIDGYGSKVKYKILALYFY